LTAFANHLQDFAKVFVSLFVAMDPLSILPFLVPFLGHVGEDRQKFVIRVALITGAAIGIAFLAVGRAVFSLLGITVSHFLIAGGLILLVISLRDLTGGSRPAVSEPNELLAVVPLGTPLLVGPAAISLLILMSTLYAWWLVVAGFALNLLVAWIVFSQSKRIVAVLGKGGLEAFSKIAFLLLAAIAVQLISRGLLTLFPGLSA